MKTIKGFIVRHQVTEASNERASEVIGSQSMTPSVSAVDDELFKTSLSVALMESAEVTQPWSTIGVDQWIESGRWWLLRSQMELYAVSVPKQKVPLAAYTNLIKASWILVDIIACHPQVPFIRASTHSEVQLLSAELKNEFLRLSTLESIVPDLSELEGQDLRIWETQARGPLLRPQKDSQRLDEWIVDGGEQVLFQRFAVCKLRVLTESLPCIFLFLVHGDGKSARLVAQNQNGSVIIAVSFEKPVQISEFDCSVAVHGENITFNTSQDAQFLSCLIEATNFYYFDRRAEHSSLADLKAYVLITAVKNQRKDVIEQLSQRPSPNEDLPESESEGGPAAVASMLASQQIAIQPVESSDSNTRGSTLSLYFWAVQCGLTPLVKVLLTELPKTEGNDWQGKTPLGFASLCGCEPIVRLLISNGADVQVTDGSGLVALHHACSKGHERVVRLLLRSGADVGANANKSRSSALHVAAQNGHENVVQLLIDRGANIEAKDFTGSTPLCEAARLHHEAVIALLLEEGASVNRRNSEGMNATHFAVESQMSDSTVRAVLAQQLSGKVDIRSPVDEAALRKENVVLMMDSDWARIYLDSPHAFIEMPKGIPSNVVCAYNRTIVITKPSGTSAKFFQFDFEFIIVHCEDTLAFSISHGTLGTTKAGGWVKLKVVNGGERTGRQTGLGGRNFQVFTGVESGKTALRDSMEDRTVYRNVKDQLFKNLTWSKD